ncbi:MAG: ABC transporter substrate-binding protein [Eubacteriales bacterium]|nr:ABC transporter substrate-binding protein [Eubacteriales bacterium]
MKESGSHSILHTGNHRIRTLKTVLAILAAAVVVCGALAGCGTSASSSGGSTGSASGGGSGTEPQKQEAAAAEENAEKSTGAADAAAGISGENAAPDHNAAVDTPLREMNVVLDWYPNAIHAFLYAAIERGYFAEEGLDVKIRFPANDNDAIALVAAGKAEIGLYYQQDTIQAAVNQKAPVKSIGAVCQTPLNVILSLKEKNINTPSDFVGRTVGYGGTALSEAMVEAIMENVGADPSSVNMQNVGFDLMSSMTTGQVDATIGCLVNHEVPQLEEEGFEVSWFQLTDYGMPNFYELVFLANDKMIEEEPETLQAFLRACGRGFDDFRDDTDAVLNILLSNQNEENFPLSPAVEAKSAAVLLPRMETEDAPFMTQTAENWQENIQWMYDRGLISRIPEVHEVMVDLLPSASAE